MVSQELKKYTTFQIGGEAKNVFFPSSMTELVELLKIAKNPLVLGAASNILISSSGIEEPVIFTTNIKDFVVTKNIVEAECGVKGQFLARETQKLGLSGFEFMIGFPGTIGGMVYMNASAHAQSVSDKILSCVIYDLKSKKIIDLNKKDMEFAYRSSILNKKEYVLLSAKFQLDEMDKDKIDDIINRNIEFRKTHQPSLTSPNAGSVFKNPIGDSAGRLLDLAGVKELSVGCAHVFDKHANFIVNDDNATSLEISQLILNMYNKVKEKYKIELEPEIKFVGKMTKEEKLIWAELLKK